MNYRTRYEHRRARVLEQRAITRGHPREGMPGGIAQDVRLGLDHTTAGDTFGQFPHEYFANEMTGERDRVTRQLRASERRVAHSFGGQASRHSLDPLRA